MRTQEELNKAIAAWGIHAMHDRSNVAMKVLEVLCWMDGNKAGDKFGKALDASVVFFNEHGIPLDDEMMESITSKYRKAVAKIFAAEDQQPTGSEA